MRRQLKSTNDSSASLRVTNHSYTNNRKQVYILCQGVFILNLITAVTWFVSSVKTDNIEQILNKKYSEECRNIPTNICEINFEIDRNIKPPFKIEIHYRSYPSMAYQILKQSPIVDKNSNKEYFLCKNENDSGQEMQKIQKDLTYSQDLITKYIGQNDTCVYSVLQDTMDTIQIRRESNLSIVNYSQDVINNFLKQKTDNDNFFWEGTNDFIIARIKKWTRISSHMHEIYRYGEIEEQLAIGNYTALVNMSFLPKITNFERFVVISESRPDYFQGKCDIVLSGVLVPLLLISVLFGQLEFIKKFKKRTKKVLSQKTANSETDKTEPKK